ncbi:PAS domain S-box protein [Halobacteriales archaeon Cl-PHB]
MSPDPNRNSGSDGTPQRVIYATVDGAETSQLQTQLRQRGNDIEVELVRDCSTAVEQARETDTACIVTDHLDSCCRSAYGQATPPVVLFTDQNLEGRTEPVDELVDTVVERDAEHSVAFLAEKIRSVAIRPETRRDTASAEALQLTDRVGRYTVDLFALDDAGQIRWSTAPFTDVFPADGSTEERSNLTFDERLANLASPDPSGVAEGARDRITSPADSGQLLAVPTAMQVRYYRRFSYPAEGGYGSLDGSVDRIEAVQDVTGLAAQFERLRLFEVLAEETRDGLAVIDEKGYLEYVNESLAEMLGYDRETLLGAHASLPMAEGELARGQQFVQQLLDDDERDSIKYELTYRTADGSDIEIGFHTTLRSDGDDYSGLISVMRDVTERKRREERLEQFAHVLSHDLRNPLSVAQGRATLLAEDADLSDSAETHLQQIVSQLERMEGLIDDVLALAQDGTQSSETGAVDLAAVATDAWRNVETPEATLACETDSRILADHSRLLQIFENLFRNAVDHGGDGVRVEVGDLANDGSGFYVADDGPGIDADDREDVFDQGFTTTPQGTGFGLAIVQQLAHAHDWTVDLTRSEHGGARFEFRGVAEDAASP